MRETSSSPWSIAGRSYPSYGSTDYRHPATYCESGSEAETRTVHLRDALLGVTLDLNRLTAEEREAVRAQITFMKEYRETIRFGNFYRLRSPFEGNFTAWIAVSLDRRTALVGWYRLLSGVNGPCRRIRLQGWTRTSAAQWTAAMCHYGEELMRAGLLVTDSGAGSHPAAMRRTFLRGAALNHGYHLPNCQLTCKNLAKSVRYAYN